MRRLVCHSEFHHIAEVAAIWILILITFENILIDGI